MANIGNRYANFGDCFFIAAIVTSFIFSTGFVDCRKVQNKAVIKTIKGDGDELIECIDIYKQPALSHPLLKNHTIQMKPSESPSGNGTASAEDELFQTWRQYGECPEGTIPTTQGFDRLPSKAMPQFNSNKEQFDGPPPGHEYAQVTLHGRQYIGAQARFNVWGPASFNQENSIAQIWVVGGEGNSVSTVEAGWIVNRADRKPNLFTYWTGDHYQNSGCYNLACPGFVQINRKFALGAHLSPVSSYNGKQYDVLISIYKNTNSGHWWLQVGNEVLGYWPDSILPTLRHSAEFASFGGEIYNSKFGGRHTSTQMGSGHFPNEDFGKASYVRNLKYMEGSLQLKDPERLIPYVTNPLCYNLFVKNKTPDWGVNFFFGGPGYSAACK